MNRKTKTQTESTKCILENNEKQKVFTAKETSQDVPSNRKITWPLSLR